uniref:Uncharacterized protein n=1 Tax=Oryza rufipogon TaxID=4529 RepID=A0A0E0QUB3_ORYRU
MITLTFQNRQRSEGDSNDEGALAGPGSVWRGNRAEDGADNIHAAGAGDGATIRRESRGTGAAGENHGFHNAAMRVNTASAISPHFFVWADADAAAGGGRHLEDHRAHQAVLE